MKDTPDLKEIIEVLVCPVHREHPSIETQPDGSLKIDCCCVHFKVQCKYILKTMLANNNRKS
jgi:hypothetical protein